jgi:hypothetical protein
LNEGLIVALAAGLIQVGILLATVRFLGKRQDEYQKATRTDLNGLGRIARSIMAETIIQAKDDADFPVIVRKLINGI